MLQFQFGNVYVGSVDASSKSDDGKNTGSGEQSSGMKRKLFNANEGAGPQEF